VVSCHAKNHRFQLKEKTMTMPLLVLMLMMATTAATGEWSRFRGPNGSGISEASGLPVEFGPAKNMIWRSEVPYGRSSPILTARCVVVTGSRGQKLITTCLDRGTGRVVWQREISRERELKVYAGNDTATPTPTSDGKNVYVFFPDFGLVSYRLDGNERWRLKLGPFDSFYGISASPVVHGNTLVQVCDQKSGSYIVAVSTDTGRVLWRKERYQNEKGAMTETFSTPVVWLTKGGSAQVIVSGYRRIDAYALDSGEKLWWVGNQGTFPISSPVLSEGIIYAVTQGSDAPMYPPWETFLQKLDANKDGKLTADEVNADASWRGHFGFMDRDGDGFFTAAEYNSLAAESVSEHGLAAVRAGGAGDQTATGILWRFKKQYSDVITPLVYRGVLYLVKDGGIVTSLNPATGEVWKSGRSKDAIEAYFASPVGADGKVYLISQDGKVSVLKADSQWEVLAVNDLGEECQATPAIGDQRIFIRTAKALYCFGEKH
jgi:outer membrane protein assembly factor BamB